MSHTDQPTYAPNPGGSGPAPVKGSNGIATAGFVLSLLGLLGSWIPVLNVLGILLAVVGSALAAVGLAKAKVGAGMGLALAGIVLGVFAVILALLVNVVFVADRRVHRYVRDQPRWRRGYLEEGRFPQERRCRRGARRDPWQPRADRFHDQGGRLERQDQHREGRTRTPWGRRRRPVRSCSR